MRLIAVLGYSDQRTKALHPVCAARLALAESVVRHDDTVLLSGWARRRSGHAEAELMAHAWKADVDRIVLDRDARSTVGNALGIARAARRMGAREVVLVTSGWHGKRASLLVRAALAGSQVTVASATTHERPTSRARLRELVCWLALPVLAVVVARRGSVQA
jgi:uncharacterized SAM-binding protein YcdF (DUF218 family)